jgi:hypothetical protein
VHLNVTCLIGILQMCDDAQMSCATLSYKCCNALHCNVVYVILTIHLASIVISLGMHEHLLCVRALQSTSSSLLL